MQIMQTIQSYLSLFLSLANVVVILYTLKMFLNRPHDTLVKRVDIQELDIKDVRNMLKRDYEHFGEIDATNEVIINSLMALIEFEMQYCLVEHKEMSQGLTKAKDDLNKFLARR